MGEVFDIRTGRQLSGSREMTTALQAARAGLALGGLPDGWTQSPSPAVATAPERRVATWGSKALIEGAVSTIIAAGILSESMAQKGELLDETLYKVMHEDINDRLDTLNTAEQEVAWRMASEILDYHPDV